MDPGPLTATGAVRTIKLQSPHERYWSRREVATCEAVSARNSRFSPAAHRDSGGRCCRRSSPRLQRTVPSCLDPPRRARLLASAGRRGLDVRPDRSRPGSRRASNDEGAEVDCDRKEREVGSRADRCFEGSREWPELRCAHPSAVARAAPAGRVRSARASRPVGRADAQTAVVLAGGASRKPDKSNKRGQEGQLVSNSQRELSAEVVKSSTGG